jgi:Laminin G domain
MACLRHSASGLRRFLGAAAVLLTASAFLGTAPAVGATAATWEMNERASASTMHDSSSSGLDGRIGSAVETGVVAGGATGYRWPTRRKDGHRPERLVTVASSRLNPRSDVFAVTIRMRTMAGNQNIIQKGQAHTAGGMFKVDMVRGRVICLFKGSRGRVAIGSRQTVWDGAWHTVRCKRLAGQVRIVVDGVRRTNRGATGYIANNWALSIGGKLRCDPPAVECDYYVGLLDRAIVRKW